MQNDAFWPGMLATSEVTQREKHHIFEMFQLYQEAYIFEQDNLISKSDFDLWQIRLKQDLANVKKYREWWNTQEERNYRGAWNSRFLDYIGPLIKDATTRADGAG